MSAKQRTSPTIYEYHGQTSRLCAALGITQVGGRDVNKAVAEFEAVSAWLKDQQKKTQGKQ